MNTITNLRYGWMDEYPDTYAVWNRRITYAVVAMVGLLVIFLLCKI